MNMLRAIAPVFTTIAFAGWVVFVALVSAMWAVWLFLLRREAEPGAELDLSVDFVGRQNGQWLIEVVARLTNRGAVRHWYRQFQVVVRYLLPEDRIVDGPERINHQLLCTRTIDERIDKHRR
jgi:hypothetical protein